mgnify:CR=1 FL=1
MLNSYEFHTKTGIVLFGSYPVWKFLQPSCVLNAISLKSEVHERDLTKVLNCVCRN